MTSSTINPKDRVPASDLDHLKLANRMMGVAALAFALLAIGFFWALSLGEIMTPTAWPGLKALVNGQSSTSPKNMALIFGVLLLLTLPLVRNFSLLFRHKPEGGRTRVLLLWAMSTLLLALATWQLF